MELMSRNVTIYLTDPQRQRLAEIQWAIAASNEKTLMLTQTRDVMVTTILEFNNCEDGSCEIAPDGKALIFKPK